MRQLFLLAELLVAASKSDVSTSCLKCLEVGPTFVAEESDVELPLLILLHIHTTLHRSRDTAVGQDPPLEPLSNVPARSPAETNKAPTSAPSQPSPAGNPTPQLTNKAPTSLTPQSSASGNLIPSTINKIPTSAPPQPSPSSNLTPSMTNKAPPSSPLQSSPSGKQTFSDTDQAPTSALPLSSPSGSPPPAITHKAPMSSSPQPSPNANSVASIANKSSTSSPPQASATGRSTSSATNKAPTSSTLQPSPSGEPTPSPSTTWAPQLVTSAPSSANSIPQLHMLHMSDVVTEDSTPEPPKNIPQLYASTPTPAPTLLEWDGQQLANPVIVLRADKDGRCRVPGSVGVHGTIMLPTTVIERPTVVTMGDGRTYMCINESPRREWPRQLSAKSS